MSASNSKSTKNAKGTSTPIDKLKDLNILSKMKSVGNKTMLKLKNFKHAFAFDVDEQIKSQQPTGFNQVPHSTLNILGPQSYAELFQSMEIEKSFMNNNDDSKSYNDHHFHVPNQDRHYDFYPSHIASPTHTASPQISTTTETGICSDDDDDTKSPPLLHKGGRKRAAAASFVFTRQEILSIFNASVNDCISEDENEDFGDVMEDFEIR